MLLIGVFAKRFLVGIKDAIPGVRLSLSGISTLSPKFNFSSLKWVIIKHKDAKMKNSSSNSTKGVTLVEIMIVVVIIGLLTAMAIPAFQKVRQSAQDKAVLDNARLLAVAADQYFLENGVSTVTLDKLVGPANFVKELKIIANETYPLTFSQGVPVKVTGVAGARTVVFPP